MEESLLIELQDLDDVVSTPTQPLPTNGHSQLLSTGTHETVNSAAYPIFTPSAGETSMYCTYGMTNEDKCRDFLEQTCGC